MKDVRCGQCGCDTVRLRVNEPVNGAGFTRIEATCTKCGETSVIQPTFRLDFRPASDEQSGQLTSGLRPRPS